MISFKYSDIHYKFIFNPNIIYEIIIENPKYYYKFIIDLLTFNENTVLFSDNDIDILDNRKEYILITDPFLIDPNSKKYLTSIYKNSDTRYLNDQRRLKLNNIRKEIFDLVEEVSSDFNISTTYNGDISLCNILEMINFKINNSNITYCERLLAYLKSIQELFDIKFVFIVNFLDIIDIDEMDAFLNDVSLLGINLINISGRKSFVNYKHVKSIIIDNDLCEL